MRQLLLFVNLFLAGCIGATAQTRQVNLYKKIILSNEAEQLSVKVSTSKDFFLLQQSLNRLENLSTARAKQNTAFNRKYTARQYSDVINNSSLSIQKRKNSLAAMGMGSSRDKEQAFKEFVSCNSKFYAAFPELRSFPHDDKVKILSRAAQLSLKNQKILQ